MLNRLATGILIFTCLSFNVWAALPPYYQTNKEIMAILNDSSIADKISSGRSIDSIIKTTNGFSIKARECQLEVFVDYAAQSMPGPANFSIRSGDLICEISPEIKDKELEDKD